MVKATLDLVEARFALRTPFEAYAVMWTVLSCALGTGFWGMWFIR
jgi:hypothetical protein